MNNFQIRSEKTSLVRCFHYVGEHHSNATIKYSTVQNSVKNSPITKQDIKMALYILRYIIAVVKGSTAQIKVDMVGEKG